MCGSFKLPLLVLLMENLEENTRFNEICNCICSNLKLLVDIGVTTLLHVNSIFQTICGLMVAQNAVELLIGLKALPVGTKVGI